MHGTVNWLPTCNQDTPCSAGLTSRWYPALAQIICAACHVQAAIGQQRLATIPPPKGQRSVESLHLRWLVALMHADGIERPYLHPLTMSTKAADQLLSGPAQDAACGYAAGLQLCHGTMHMPLNTC